MHALIVAVAVAVGSLYLAPPPASVSLGNASNGHLVGGVPLPMRGRHHRVIPSTRARGFVHGTRELVSTLLGAARAVARKYRGAILQVGNLSRKGGGDLPGSASHNSGRDVDVPFYVTDSRGRPVPDAGFARFDARGRAGALRFDVGRNWTFVRYWLGRKRIQVQWIFVADPLKNLLVRYARRKREPSWLIDRALEVLGQPGNSSAHAEHFHIRLYCALHERLLGCLNYGPTWPWVDDYAKEMTAETARLVAAIPGADGAAAVRKIGAIRGHSGLVGVIAALRDPRPAVRTAAAEVLPLLSGAETATPTLIALAEAATDPAWADRLVRTLAVVGDARMAAPLERLVRSRKAAEPETRVLAVQGLARLLHLPATPVLGEALNDPSRAVRAAAAAGLRRVTNQSFAPGARGVARFRAWWQKNAQRARMDWVRDGFQRLFRLRFTPRAWQRSIRKLVGLIRGGGAVAFNARALLADLTGFEMKRGHFSDVQMYRFYRSWLRRGGAKRRP